MKSIILIIGMITMLILSSCTPLPREPTAPLPREPAVPLPSVNDTTLVNTTIEPLVNDSYEIVYNVTEVPAGDNFVSKENVLQNKQLTPGALNPVVRQETINETICEAGYTTSIRPNPTWYNDNLLERMQIYGYDVSLHLKYQDDNLIPINLGGCPNCSDNLWPQSYPAANFKDTLENKLHKMVCNGSIVLKEAQDCIVEDWTKCADKYDVVITYK